MDLKQLVMLAFRVSILCTVFGFGLQATTRDLLYLVRRPGLLARSLLAMFGIMPLLAVGLTHVFDLRPTLEIALVALAISPVPPLLPKRESKAGGHRSYGLGLMAILALLAIIVVPLATEILGWAYARPCAMAPGALVRVVLFAALLPLVAGMIVRAVLPRVADRIEKPIGLVAKVLLPLAVLVLLAGTWRAVWAVIGDGSILSMVAFIATGLLVGHALGGPDRDHSVVLALSTASRHPAIALSIAATNFPDEHFRGTILLYLIVTAVAGSLYLAWQRRQVAPVSA